ncbi:hypothetical protein SAMN02745823_01223 [Sporobacter termitidis DSM 10068]|uniref:Outer membrane lipoprotein-sorting protein n=2 Tax=Sporobacter TaxID=44748 RepID=A0A1M5WE68_9FIRM|nr:hypothetical protein SAMN02745823_01223 [Sporobacter termitidis DSM 10068]
MIPLMLLFLLSACSAAKSGGQELALDIRANLLKATKIDMTADVTANYDDRTYQFTLTYSGNADRGTVVISAPKEVAGLKAEVSVSGGTISYDGANLDTGPLTGDGLSPAEAVPVLISQWETGYISGCNYEKLGDDQALAVSTDVTETVSQRTWFDVKTQLPIRAELSDGGRLVIACVFKNAAVE